VTTQHGSVLAARRGRLILLLLCAVQFIDVADSSIMNVALPSIRRDLGFSVQNLQWVLSGYLVTYGGLLLLGGRAGDLLGRRRLLAAGTTAFAACSLAGGLAVSAAATCTQTQRPAANTPQTTAARHAAPGLTRALTNRSTQP
jgi:MFS family permease